MVDKSKRSGADVAAADLDACFSAMGLEDSTLLRRPQPQPRARSDREGRRAATVPDGEAALASAAEPRARGPEPLQVPPVPTMARADALQQCQMERQHWPPPPSHAAVGEIGSAAAYASLLGSRSPSGFFGPSSPRLPKGPFPSVSEILRAPVPPSSAMPSKSTNQHQPRPSIPPLSAIPSASTNHHQAMAMGFAPHHHHLHAPASPLPSVLDLLRASVPPPPAMPSTSNYNYQPMPMGSAASHHGASASVAWDHVVSRNPFASAPAPSSALPAAGPSRNHAGLDPYATAYQPRTASASFAQNYHASLDPYAPAFPHPKGQSAYHYELRPLPTLEEVRSSLLRRPMDPSLVMVSPQTAAYVVRLLQEDGGGAMRRNVLAGLKRAVHRVMQQGREGRDVFVALLGACQMRFDELSDIVGAVLSGQGVLKDITKHNHGMAALKALATAVAPHDQLSMRFINWLITERPMADINCEELIRHCCDMIPYHICSLMIRFAIHYIEPLLLSSPGSRFVAVCFEKARNEELRAFEFILLTQTIRLAMGQYSNYLLQRALQCGSADLKERLATRIAEDVADLSSDKFGSYVVEACLSPTASLVPMQLVVAAFLRLRNDQLADLVRGDCSNYVVQKLLDVGRTHFRQQAMDLVLRIIDLPEDVLADMHAQQVMRIIKKFYLRPRRHH